MSENQNIPTRFETFVLSYLYSEELSWRNDPVKSKITKNRPYLNVQKLVTILPPSIAGNMQQDDIIEQLSMLEEQDCIEVGMLHTSSEGFGSFSISNNGILLIKKIFGDLQNSINEKKSFEEEIDILDNPDLDDNPEMKNWLKGIWNSLKSKAQDEIADYILSQVKLYGTPLILLMIELIKNKIS